MDFNSGICCWLSVTVIKRRGRIFQFLFMFALTVTTSNRAAIQLQVPLVTSQARACVWGCLQKVARSFP